MDQPDQGIADDIAKAARDSAEAKIKSAIAARNLQRSFALFGGVISSTGSAFTDTSTEFKKFNKVVDSSEKFINNISGNFGPWGAVLNAVTFGLSALAKSVFAYSDNLLKSYDNLSDFGGTLDVSSKDLKNLIKESGYYTANTAAFDNAIRTTGSAFINLGWDSSGGVKQLAKILSVQNIEGALSGFLNLGLSPEAVTNAQVEYIKMQESLGISLKNNADKVRMGSLDYIRDLSLASSLTGESRGVLAKTMARQLVDYKFASRIRQLEMSGRKEDADRLVLFASIVDQQYGPEHGIIVRDFIANGFPTTAEGEGALIAQRGELGEMTRQLANGQISVGEANKKYAGNLVKINDEYGESIRASESLQKEIGMTGKAFNAAVTNYEKDIKSDEVLRKENEEAYKRNSDAMKNLQNQDIITKRVLGQKADELNQNMAPAMNDVITTLTKLVTNVAKKMAYLARWLSGGDSSETFNNVMLALGDASELSQLSTKLTEEAKAVDKKIKKQEPAGIATDIAKKKYEKAQEEQQRLIERKKAGQAVTGKEERNVIDTVNESRLILEETKAQERKRYGKTTEELKAERESLLKRAEEAKKSAAQKSQVEQAETKKAAMAETLDKSSLMKYMTFGSGTGDLNHFQTLAEKNPKLASSVLNLAKEYYKINGKPLTINSSHRSTEEQQAIYDAWVRAGGNKNKKFAGGYYMPKNPALGKSAHTANAAVDIDPAQLDSLGSSVLSKFGLERPNPNDPVHVTLKSDQSARLDASQVQAMNPPDFMAHGTEAIVPMLDGNTVGMEMKTSSKSNDFSEIKTNMSKMKPDNSLIQKFAGIKPNRKVIDNFITKIDDLANAIDQSTSIQNDIKMYSMS